MSYQLMTGTKSDQPACSLHIQVDGLHYCVPQPPPHYVGQLYQWYGVVPADLAGLTASPPLRMTSLSCQLERAFALKICSSGLATHKAIFEDQGWLLHLAELKGIWDCDLLYPDRDRDESPTVSMTSSSVFL